MVPYEIKAMKGAFHRNSFENPSGIVRKIRDFRKNSRRNVEQHPKKDGMT